MLKEGDRVPDFEAEASNGETVRMSQLVGKPVVLFFYPKAFTTGCTIETRGFAQASPEIESLGAHLVGISKDDLDTQCDFARDMGAGFPLLADPNGEIAKAFGVKRLFPSSIKRVTYIIDEQGIVEKTIKSELHFSRHVEDVLEHLRRRG